MAGVEGIRPGPPIPKKAKFRNALVFVGVVWSLAGAFLALQAGKSWLWRYAYHSGRVPAEMAMAKPSAASVARCRELLGAAPITVSDPNLAKLARHGAWLLGHRIGTGAGLVNAEVAAREAIEKELLGLRPVSQFFSVPDVALPTPSRGSFALRDFGWFLADDPQCVAAAFERKYSPQHAAMYRFGAVVGHAAVYRTSSPRFGPVMETQIRYYGAAAGVAPELWQPLLENSIAIPPGQNLAQAVQALVNRIDAQLRPAQ